MGPAAGDLQTTATSAVAASASAAVTSKSSFFFAATCAEHKGGHAAMHGMRYTFHSFLSLAQYSSMSVTSRADQQSPEL